MKNLLTLLFCCLTTLSSLAQNPTPPLKLKFKLQPGDPAPALKVGRWLKGKPIDTLEQGKIYVLDFWGTKCGYCIASFPELRSLQRRYKQVEFIQLAVVRWSPTQLYPDDEEIREKFVNNRGYEMVNRVAEDSPDGFMVEHWLKASGVSSLPRLIIVDHNKRMAWSGKLEDFELALATVVAQAPQALDTKKRRN